jgi:hypothetical protein
VAQLKELEARLLEGMSGWAGSDRSRERLRRMLASTRGIDDDGRPVLRIRTADQPPVAQLTAELTAELTAQPLTAELTASAVSVSVDRRTVRLLFVATLAADDSEPDLPEPDDQDLAAIRERLAAGLAAEVESLDHLVSGATRLLESARAMAIRLDGVRDASGLSRVSEFFDLVADGRRALAAALSGGHAVPRDPLAP